MNPPVFPAAASVGAFVGVAALVLGIPRTLAVSLMLLAFCGTGFYLELAKMRASRTASTSSATKTGSTP